MTNCLFRPLRVEFSNISSFSQASIGTWHPQGFLGTHLFVESFTNTVPYWRLFDRSRRENGKSHIHFLPKQPVKIMVSLLKNMYTISRTIYHAPGAVL